MTIGIIAFQGSVSEHIKALKNLGVSVREVRSVSEFNTVDGLIIPGGESTVIGKFLSESGLRERIIERVKDEGLPIYGTCAGAILLSKKVIQDKSSNSTVEPMELIDITVERNAYGRQTESFEADLPLQIDGDAHVHAVFIRAPIIESVGEGIEILASIGDNPVFCRQRNVLISSFHPELLVGESDVHVYFVSIVDKWLNR